MPESWEQLKNEAPELASAVERRLQANLHHILGTIRADGSPRLSGTEVQITPTQLRLGMMPDSQKLQDVIRDPRVEIHTAPVDVELKDGDAKLSGALRPDGETERAPGSAFIIDFDNVSLVRVDNDELEFTTWSKTGGLHVTRRT